MPSPPPLHLPPDCVLLPPANNQAAQRAQAALLELARHTGKNCLLDDLALRALGRGKIGINSLLHRYRLESKLGGHSRGLNSVSLGKLGNIEVAATSSDDLQVILWNLDERRPLLELRTEHEIVVTQATLLQNERLATSCMDGQVRLHHLGKHQQVRAQDRLLVQHRGAVYRIAAPCGSSELLLSGGEDGQVFLHDFRVPHPTKLLALRDRKDRKVQVYSVACSPVDPQQFCLTGRDSSLKLYDLRKSNIVTSSLAPPSLPIDTETNPNMAAYNESGSELAVSYDFLSYTDKKIYIFQSSANPSTAPIGVLHSYRDSPVLSWFDDEIVISGSNTAYAGLTTGDILFWDRNSGGILHRLQGDGHGIVRGLAPHRHQSLLLSCGVDKQLKIWAPGPEQLWLKT